MRLAHIRTSPKRKGGRRTTPRLRFGRVIKRPALSLLEVIIAMAIFLMAVVVIGQLVTMGGERALEVDQQSEATMLCQSKLSELASGALPLSSQSDQAFDEAPDYKYSIDCSQNNVSNLWNVTVTVMRERSDGTKIQTTLSQMLLDPSVRGSSQDTVSISGTPSSGMGQSGASPSSSGQMPSAQGQGAMGAGAQPKTNTPSGAQPKSPTPGGTQPKTTTPSPAQPKAATPSPAQPKAATPAPSTSKGGR
jgi:Tfp pilus assembly protein PilV